MRHLFLIQAHRDPDQIARLVRTLHKGYSGSVALISHDERSATLPRSLFDHGGDVHIIRGRGGRGDFSIVDGYLAALRWLRDNKINYEWLTNLSGQDYPVSSLAEFSRELAKSSHDGFLHHFDVLQQDPQLMAPMAWPTRHGYERYYYQYTKLKNDLSVVERAVLRIPRLAIEWATDKIRINTAYGLLIGRPAARHPFTAEFRCYAGSYWHTIRRRCADHLLAFCEAKPDVVEYFRNVLIPDESFVHTVLANHPAFHFVNDNRRYFDMRGSRRGHPKSLTESDVAQVAGQHYVFARKVEWASGPYFFDKLDRYALAPDRHVPADVLVR
jgi:hypothetical protein